MPSTLNTRELPRQVPSTRNRVTRFGGCEHLPGCPTLISATDVQPAAKPAQPYEASQACASKPDALDAPVDNAGHSPAGQRLDHQRAVCPGATDDRDAALRRIQAAGRRRQRPQRDHHRRRDHRRHQDSGQGIAYQHRERYPLHDAAPIVRERRPRAPARAAQRDHQRQAGEPSSSILGNPAVQLRADAADRDRGALPDPPGGRRRWGGRAAWRVWSEPGAALRPGAARDHVRGCRGDR